MSKRNFLVSCAKRVFVFSAVLMASVALSSCSKNDDENSELPIKQNTVIIDNKERSIIEAAYTDTSDEDNFEITLFLSEDHNEKVVLLHNEKWHSNKDIDLTKREEQHEGYEWYWAIEYNRDGKQIINTYGKPKTLYKLDEAIRPVFNKGTLRISTGEDDNIKILLNNGNVVGADNKTHTITIHYDGQLQK